MSDTAPAPTEAARNAIRESCIRMAGYALGQGLAGLAAGRPVPHCVFEADGEITAQSVELGPGDPEELAKERLYTILSDNAQRWGFVRVSEVAMGGRMRSALVVDAGAAGLDGGITVVMPFAKADGAPLLTHPPQFVEGGAFIAADVTRPLEPLVRSGLSAHPAYASLEHAGWVASHD